MRCKTCSSEISLPQHPLGSKEYILKSLREGVLSSSNIPDIRKNILDAQNILKVYDKEIRRLMSMAGHLREHIEETSFLLSPIRRLPDEILAEIFKNSMPSGTVFSCTKQTPPSPSFLTVCVRWRTVALSIPSIWQSITLDFGGISHMHSHQNLEVLDHHLSKLSISCPLNIDIYCGRLKSSCTEIFSAHIDSLIKRSSRWMSLSLTGPWSLTERLNTIENFPSLRELHLSISIPSSAISSVLKKSPGLTYLSIASLPDETGPFVALSNITHLELMCSQDPTVFDVLDMCPKLISVVFYLQHHHHHISDEKVAALCSHPPRHIPSIKDITIQVEEMFDEGRDYYLLPSLLSSLRLPSLISLTLDSALDIKPFVRQDIFEALGDFFKKSCALTSLTLDRLQINDEDTVSLLQLVPSLTKLTISERTSNNVFHADAQFIPIISRRFLRCLNSYDLGHAARTTLTARRPLLPKLKHLSLTVLGETFLKDQDLLELFVSVVSSRWFPQHDLEQDYGVECLKYVKLCVVEGRVDRSIWDQLKCLDRMIVILEDEEEPHKMDG
ncbi:hypothetical protein K435DRAFT_850515 [Dendrothele bispora CBS 962.96]|uniref:Uncharacterized protein n=1 Tax=Dendrothele bispora (strain CBS 962.96) TaxID=1314807 RepID=A0A4S8MQA9_DENBC|nr:hypothetical protein K435DRAFT_850515 [Dendrothele bispora CBS 962.96]